MAVSTPAFRTGGRRSLLRGAVALAALGCLAAAAGLGAGARAEERRYTVAFANLTEEPGVTLEGTGFTGRDVRESFALAARSVPVDVVFYDNRQDRVRALANAEDAISRGVQLYIQYQADADANAMIAEKMKAAGIPVLAVNHPVPGAPLYTADNLAAGRLAGEALAQFAMQRWRGQRMVAVLVGPLEVRLERIPERAQAVAAEIRRLLPNVPVIPLDTRGNPAQVGPLLGKVLASHAGARVLVAAMDDATALAAKGALETAGRLADAAIVSHGADRSIHGGMNDRKEIDPANRGSIVLGSVAFYLDRYGYDVLPLALKMLRGESVPARAVTRHRLITAANVFIEYPPYDMN